MQKNVRFVLWVCILCVGSVILCISIDLFLQSRFEQWLMSPNVTMTHNPIDAWRARRAVPRFIGMHREFAARTTEVPSRISTEDLGLMNGRIMAWEAIDRIWWLTRDPRIAEYDAQREKPTRVFDETLN